MPKISTSTIYNMNEFSMQFPMGEGRGKAAMNDVQSKAYEWQVASPNAISPLQFIPLHRFLLILN